VCVGVSHDISTVKQTQAEQLATNAHLAHLISNQEVRLRAVIQSALSASDNEAQRIGIEIHDGLCQELVAIFRMAEKLEDVYTKQIGSPPCSVPLSKQATHALRLARGISHELTLWDLVDQKLPDALATFVHRLEDVMNTSIELNCPDKFFAFDAAESQHVYRVIREAVINAIRHGKPRHVWIDIVEEPEQIVISVANDNAEPSETPAAKQTEGIGMRQMKMRARLLSGTFRLRQTADGKTIAELVVPRDRGLPFSPSL
jgi:signal transduction histidine kinase